MSANTGLPIYKGNTLLIRDTLHYGPREINADTEFIHETIDGMKTIIPHSDHWRKILIQVSGGLDSALLLFLVAKNLKRLESKVKIQPLSFEIPTKAKSLHTARAVINKVRELTDYPHLLSGLERQIPMEHSQPPEKDRFFVSSIREIRKSDHIDFEFNGNTRNPPQEIRLHFRDDDFRQLKRDNRTTIYNTATSASPHAMVNKKGIIHLYKTEGLLDQLAPLTLSCDMDLIEIRQRNLPIPCQECWWCREREWGFQANNLLGPTAGAHRPPDTSL